MRIFIAAMTLTIAAGVHVFGQLPGTGDQPPHPDNYYAAGREVRIGTPLAGDVIVAGRIVEISQPVGGDVLVAGWHVALKAAAGDDVRMVARDLVVDGSVRGDLTVAGHDVALESQSRIAGRSWITGETVRVAGVMEREVQIAGAIVRLAGEIRGPLTIVAERLELLPAARILGPMTYRGTTPIEIAPGAIVNGPMTYEPIPLRDAREARTLFQASGFVFAFHLFVTGVLIIVFLPRVEQAIVETLRTRPGPSLLAGTALLVTVPVAAVLLIISVLGLPFGLALAVGYVFVLFGGLLGTAFFVGSMEAKLLNRWPLSTANQQVAWLLAGIVTLTLMRALLGGAVVVVSVLFGVGALTLWGYAAAARQRTSATA